MLRSLCSELSRLNNIKKASIFSPVHGFRSSEMSCLAHPYSPTVSYLQNSCGLSQESAISASKKLDLKNTENADSFLNMMRIHGVTETHLKKIVEARPTLLLADLEDKIRPNLELFESLGISGYSLAQMLCKEPSVLISKAHEFVEFFRARGLTDEQISLVATKCPSLCKSNPGENFGPKIEFLSSVGLNDEDVKTILSSSPSILQASLETKLVPFGRVLSRVLGPEVLKCPNVWRFVRRYNFTKLFEPNVSLLRSRGVSEPSISAIFKAYPTTLIMKHDRFTEILDRVEKLGFDPRTPKFVLAVRSMAVISLSHWDRKLEAYKGFGLSTEQIESSFKLRPMFMLVSVEKITRSMDFLANKLSFKPSDIVRSPFLMTLSLDKTIVPRSSVLQLLMKKDILGMKSSVSNYLKMSEVLFAERVVSKHREAVPEIVEAYQGKLVLQEFPDVLRLPK